MRMTATPVTVWDSIRLMLFTFDEIGPQNCSAFCAVGDAPLPKSSLSQHFKVLREAGLIRSERKGVELQNRTRCSELKNKFGPLVTAIVRAYEAESQTNEASTPTAAPRR